VICVSANEVADLISELQSGAMTLDEVAQKVRERVWARTRRPLPQAFSDLADQLDPPTAVAGSIDDLTAEYDLGHLTWRQYRTLAEAVAESIDAEYDGAEVVADPGEEE
jgi:hypothetical protein